MLPPRVHFPAVGAFNGTHIHFQLIILFIHTMHWLFLDYYCFENLGQLTFFFHKPELPQIHCEKLSSGGGGERWSVRKPRLVQELTQLPSTSYDILEAVMAPPLSECNANLCRCKSSHSRAVIFNRKSVWRNCLDTLLDPCAITLLCVCTCACVHVHVCFSDP